MVKIPHTASSFTIHQEERHERKALWSSILGLVFVARDHVVSQMSSYRPSPIVFSFDIGTSFGRLYIPILNERQTKNTPLPPKKKQTNNNKKTACYVRACYGNARRKDLVSLCRNFQFILMETFKLSLSFFFETFICITY